MRTDQIKARRSIPVSPEQSAEIAMLVEQITRLDQGEVDPDDFWRFRLENGVYGIRGITDQHMARVMVRAPLGDLSVQELRHLARISDGFLIPGLTGLVP